MKTLAIRALAVFNLIVALRLLYLVIVCHNYLNNR